MRKQEKVFFQMVVMGTLVACLVIGANSLGKRQELRSRAKGSCGSGATMVVTRVGAKLKTVVKSKEGYIWVDLEITGPEGEEVDYDPDRFRVGKEGQYNTWTWWTKNKVKPGKYRFKFTINNHQTPKVCVQKSFTVPEASPSPSPRASPSPRDLPAQCNETCLSAGRLCASGLECVQLSDLLGSDKCRNPNCPDEEDCLCPGRTLNFKARFTGLSEDSQSLYVALKVKDTNWEEKVTTENDGTHSGLSLNGLTVGETYEFILNAHPFLTKKETLTISEGANPSSGYLDFGELKTGDLNGDNEINGIDWSLMKIYFGQAGES